MTYEDLQIGDLLLDQKRNKTFFYLIVDKRPPNYQYGFFQSNFSLFLLQEQTVVPWEPPANDFMTRDLREYYWSVYRDGELIYNSGEKNQT